MDDFDFADDGSCVRGDKHLAEVVDDELVSAWRLVSGRKLGADAPFGPKLVRTRLESSATACMLRITASSIPCRCL